MIDLSLAGLIGAILGTVVAAVVYHLFIDRLDRVVQARIQATPAEERGDLSLSIVRRIALTLDLVVFAALGYWLGPPLGGWGEGQDAEARPGRARGVPQGVRGGIRARHAILLQSQADTQLPLREGADLASIPRRACVTPLSQWRGALHRLQVVRGDLPGA